MSQTLFGIFVDHGERTVYRAGKSGDPEDRKQVTVHEVSCGLCGKSRKFKFSQQAEMIQHAEEHVRIGTAEKVAGTSEVDPNLRYRPKVR